MSKLLQNIKIEFFQHFLLYSSENNILNIYISMHAKLKGIQNFFFGIADAAAYRLGVAKDLQSNSQHIREHIKKSA